jgi:hypothetical protein
MRRGHLRLLRLRRLCGLQLQLLHIVGILRMDLLRIDTFRSRFPRNTRAHAGSGAVARCTGPAVIARSAGSPSR